MGEGCRATSSGSTATAVVDSSATAADAASTDIVHLGTYPIGRHGWHVGQRRRYRYQCHQRPGPGIRGHSNGRACPCRAATTHSDARILQEITTARPALRLWRRPARATTFPTSA